MSEEVQGSRIGTGTRIDADSQWMLRQMRVFGGQFTIKGEGNVSVEFLLEEIKLPVGTVPGSIVVNDKDHAARGFVHPKGINNIGLIQTQCAMGGGTP